MAVGSLAFILTLTIKPKLTNKILDDFRIKLKSMEDEGIRVLENVSKVLPLNGAYLTFSNFV